MSHQAVNWAIEQRAGGPSPKATLWSIANYANEDWCSWPSQDTIGAESEQARSTVRRQVVNLEAVGLIRCIPMRHAGRRSGNFYILKPSPYFGKSVAEIEPLLPRGYTPLVSGDDVGSSQSDLENDASSCGIVSDDDAPNDAPNDGSNDGSNDGPLVTHQENPRTLEPRNLVDDDGVARARENLRKAFEVTKQLATIAGIGDAEAWPPGWKDAANRIDQFLQADFTPEILLMGASEVMAGRTSTEPIYSVEYFAKAFAKVKARRAKLLPVVHEVADETIRNGFVGRIDSRRPKGTAKEQRWDEAFDNVNRGLGIARTDESGGSIEDGPPIAGRLPEPRRS